MSVVPRASVVRLAKASCPPPRRRWSCPPRSPPRGRRRGHRVAVDRLGKRDVAARRCSSPASPPSTRPRCHRIGNRSWHRPAVDVRRAQGVGRKAGQRRRAHRPAEGGRARPFTTESARGVATASLSTVLANVTLPPAVLFASKSAVNTTALPVGLETGRGHRPAVDVRRAQGVGRQAGQGVVPTAPPKVVVPAPFTTEKCPRRGHSVAVDRLGEGDVAARRCSSPASPPSTRPRCHRIGNRSWSPPRR